MILNRVGILNWYMVDRSATWMMSKKARRSYNRDMAGNPTSTALGASKKQSPRLSSRVVWMYCVCFVAVKTMKYIPRASCDAIITPKHVVMIWFFLVMA